MTDHYTVTAIDYFGDCKKCGGFVFLSGREIMATTTGDEQRQLLIDLIRAFEGCPAPIYCDNCRDIERGYFYLAAAYSRAARRWRLDEHNHTFTHNGDRHDNVLISTREITERPASNRHGKRQGHDNRITGSQS